MSNGPGTPKVIHLDANHSRAFAMRAGVVALLAGAAWYGLARPLVGEVATGRAELSAMNAALSNDAGAEVTEAQIESAIGEFQSRVDRIRNWTLRPGESGKLYDGLRGLAQQFEVRIDRIEPKGESVLQAGPKAKAGEKALVVGQSVGYTLDVSGRFEAVARFIASCETQLGSSKVISFRITPSVRLAAGGEPIVIASIETQHICVSLEPTPGSVMGVSDGKVAILEEVR